MHYLAETLNNLGEIRRAQGIMQEAELLHRQALAIREHLAAPAATIAISLNNLALCLETQGDYGHALILAKRALDLRQAVFGSNHPEVASAYNNIAGIYGELGQVDNAIIAYDTALRIRDSPYAASFKQEVWRAASPPCTLSFPHAAGRSPAA